MTWVNLDDIRKAVKKGNYCMMSPREAPRAVGPYVEWWLPSPGMGGLRGCLVDGWTVLVSQDGRVLETGCTAM